MGADASRSLSPLQTDLLAELEGLEEEIALEKNATPAYLSASLFTRAMLGPRVPLTRPHLLQVPELPEPAKDELPAVAQAEEPAKEAIKQ